MSQSSTDHYRNVLRYSGQDYRFAPTYLRTRDPISPTNLSPDIKPPEQQGYYPVSSLWTNTTTDSVWLLAGIHNNLSNWILISAGGGVATYIHTPDGNNVMPVAGQINFSSPNITITGAGNTVNFDASPVLDELTFDLVNGAFPNVMPSGGVVKLRSSNASVTISGTSADTIDLISAAGTPTFIHTSDGNNATPVGGQINFASTNINMTSAGNTVTFDASPVLDELTFDLVNGAFPNVTPVNGIVKVRSADNTVTISGTSADTINLSVMGGGGGAATSFPTDNGTATPAVGVLNVFGVGPFQSVTSAPGASNTVKIKAPNCSLFIVDVDPDYGTHTTIQSALNDAAIVGGPQVVFLRPGTYVENLVIPNNITIYAFGSNTIVPSTPPVIISGKITMANAASISINNIELINNGDYIAQFNATGQTLHIKDCYMAVSNSDMFSMPNTGSLVIENSVATLLSAGTCFFTCTNGSVSIDDSFFLNQVPSLKYNVFTSSTFYLRYSYLTSPIRTELVCITGVVFSAINTGFGINITPYIGNSTIISINEFYKSDLGGGTAPAVTLGAGNATLFTDCTFSSTAAFAVTGTGRLDNTGIIFTGLGTKVSPTIVQQVNGSVGPRFPVGEGACQILSGSGSPNGLVTAPKGSMWLRTDGTTTNNRAFINTNGATAWTAVITAL